jgi:hypothetical protein
MLIANSKLRENIAEYILYMWQVEGIVRSLNFNIDSIFDVVITKMTSNEDAQLDVKDWYLELIKEMADSEILEKGHLRRVHEVMDEVFFLHNTLLTSLKDEKYKVIFTDAYSFVAELKTKSGDELNDVEICFTGLYGKLLLKMQNKKISKETEMAFTAFSRVLAYLSVKYKEFKKGDLKFQVSN